MHGLAFVHGALHWIGWKSTRCILVSFNISNEMCGEIPLLAKISLGISVGVSMLGGMLCVHSNEDKTFHLWVMKDCGVNESWIKSLTLSNNSGISSFRPICRFSNGEVLFYCLTGNRTVFRTSDGSFRLSNQKWPLDENDDDVDNVDDDTDDDVDNVDDDTDDDVDNVDDDTDDDVDNVDDDTDDDVPGFVNTESLISPKLNCLLAV
ncbi:hypothetical protein BC332_29780 [Capsicum chinense]|nr:hypothetical protein BC332_29780 [Capsicum chinense]